MIARVPRITWGAAFVNQLDIGWPLDNAVSYPNPREGSETAKGASGLEDAWRVGQDQYLEGDIRWIPTADATVPVVATGWDGATGFRAFLESARDKNIFRWIPDKGTPGTFFPVYLEAPMGDPPSIEGDGTRSIHIKIRTSDDSVFTGY